jgi:hypothetical protein
MMRRALVAVAMAAAVAMVSRPVLAHGGHEHKVMGKVVAIDEERIEVEATDGRMVTGALRADTTYLRDKVAVSRPDVKLGERVVIVVVEDKDTGQKVKQVLLGAAQSAEHRHCHRRSILVIFN